MTYNENYSFYENTVLNQMAKAMKDAHKVKVCNDNKYTVLNYAGMYSWFPTMVIVDTDKEVLLMIDGRIVQMTPLIKQECQKISHNYDFLATKNKLQISNVDVSGVPNGYDLLKIEQSRDIYKLWDKTHFNKLNEHIVTNQTKTEIVLIPYGASEVDKGRKWKSTDWIWYNRSRAREWVTRILFNKGHKIKSAESLIKKRDVNGKKEYYANINGNEFVFNTPQYATYFLGNFHGWFSKIRHRQDENAPCITFFQYKDKSCR